MRAILPKINEEDNLELENMPLNPNDKSILVEPQVSLPINEITLGDSLELAGCVPAKADLILEDMPYNTTAISWDKQPIDLEKYWQSRLEIIKPNGAIVLFSSQPFTTFLINSNLAHFRYELIWRKTMPTGMALANKRPMKYHENILVFYQQQPTFNKIMMERSEVGKDRLKNNGKILNGYKSEGQHVSKAKLAGKYSEYDPNYVNPGSVLDFNSVPNCNGTKLHPTQKPVELLRWLIETYTNPKDLVFDGFGGSGTTAVAAFWSLRLFIVIEKEKKYFDLATRRLAQERNKLSLMLDKAFGAS